jgi:hypothetical protein
MLASDGLLGTNSPPTSGGYVMDIEGVVHNGVIVPDDATALSEGTRVRIMPVASRALPPFGGRFAQFKGAIGGLAADLAQQHEHYRLGTPKR